MRSIIQCVAVVCCALAPAPAWAQVGYRCALPWEPCPAYNPENGHYYAYILQKMNWDDAQAAAASFTYHGVQGHLATITSSEENDFLIREGLVGNFWIGASDRDVEGEWRWVVGPEAGELIWIGGVDGTAVAYSNWEVDQPNNRLDGQDYATMGWSLHKWNDVVPDDEFFTGGPLIEFSVPEPSTYAILAIGGTTLAIHARRRRS